MWVNFAKSLDRPIDILGIKGKWLTVFLIMAGVSIVFALMVGFTTSAGVGISCAIVLIALSFIGCMFLQGKVSSRQLAKYNAAGKMPPMVYRRETLYRILTKDPKFVEKEVSENH